MATATLPKGSDQIRFQVQYKGIGIFQPKSASDHFSQELIATVPDSEGVVLGYDAPENTVTYVFDAKLKETVFHKIASALNKFDLEEYEAQVRVCNRAFDLPSLTSENFLNLVNSTEFKEHIQNTLVLRAEEASKEPDESAYPVAKAYTRSTPSDRV